MTATAGARVGAHPDAPDPVPDRLGEDLSGLGTRAARWFLLGPWVSVVLYTAAVWPELTLPAAAAASVVVLLAEVLAVSAPGTTLRGLPALVAATTPAIGAVLLLVATGGDLDGRTWNVQVGALYLSLLLVRGRYRLAWAAYALHTGLLVTVAVTTGQAEDLPALLALPAAAMGTGVYWRGTLRANARSAELARRAADEAEVAAAAHRTAAARALAQLADVRSLARDTLDDLRRADALTDGLRRRSARLEVTVREGLRAPRLAAEPVSGATRRARDRGLVVRLLDDSQGAPVDAAVLERITDVLDETARGEVVVRLAPPGRDYAATVLLEDDEVHALRIAPDGR